MLDWDVMVLRVVLRAGRSLPYIVVLAKSQDTRAARPWTNVKVCQCLETATVFRLSAMEQLQFNVASCSSLLLLLSY